MSRNAHADRYIGRHLRDRRIAAHKTQSDLAAALDLHREAISAIENGRQSLTVAQLVIVLRYLSLVDPDDILRGVPDITPKPASYA